MMVASEKSTVAAEAKSGTNAAAGWRQLPLAFSLLSNCSLLVHRGPINPSWHDKSDLPCAGSAARAHLVGRRGAATRP
jgi:hypothetical protein